MPGVPKKKTSLVSVPWGALGRLGRIRAKSTAGFLSGDVAFFHPAGMGSTRVIVAVSVLNFPRFRLSSTARPRERGGRVVDPRMDSARTKLDREKSAGSSVAEDEDPAQCGVEVLRYVSVNQGRVLPAPITRFPELMIPRREPA